MNSDHEKLFSEENLIAAYESILATLAQKNLKATFAFVGAFTLEKSYFTQAWLSPLSKSASNGNGFIALCQTWRRGQKNSQGRMRNASFLDDPVADLLNHVPLIEPILVEVPNPGHPFGVRGVGEVPIVPPPAAIANAIYHAIGVRLRQLPMSPPRVLHEILHAKNKPID